MSNLFQGQVEVGSQQPRLGGLGPSRLGGFFGIGNRQIRTRLILFKPPIRSDPDGNGVELYRDRPEAEWPRDAQGGLSMFTRRLDVNALLADAG